jgi:hypothetical protein
MQGCVWASKYLTKGSLFQKLLSKRKQNRIDYLEIIFVNDLLLSVKAEYPEEDSLLNSNCSPSAQGFAAVIAGGSYAVAAKK